MNNIQSLPEQLSEFGLDLGEAKIYLYLLNKEPRTIVEIARDVNIPRATVYDTSLRLLQKGLIEKNISYKSQRFRAFPLSILQTMLDKENARLEKLRKSLSNLERTVKQSFSQSTNTNVRYYHGVQGFQQMMWNSLAAKTEKVGYSQYGRAEVTGKKFINRYREEIVRKKIIDRCLVNPNKATLTHIKDYYSGNNTNYSSIRFLTEEELYISGRTNIYNNIFAVSYWTQGEIVGVEIENAEFVRNQKSIFEMLWKQAQPISISEVSQRLQNRED